MTVRSNCIRGGRLQRATESGGQVPWIIRASLLLFVCLIPLESLGRSAASSSSTITRLAGLLLLASCVCRPEVILRRPQRLTVLAFLLMTTALIRTAFIDPQVLTHAFGRYLTWIQMLVFFHIATPILAVAANRARVVYAYVAGACLTALLLIRGSGLNVAMLEKDRVSLGNLDPNIQSAVLGLAAVWVFVVLLNKRMTIRAPWALMGLPVFVLLVSANLLTGSRGGLLALFAAFVPFVFTRSARSNPLLKIALLVGGVVVMVAIALRSEDMIVRLERSLFERDTAGRDYIYASSLDLLVQRPWLGWGLAANESELGVYTNTYFRDMHNIYLYVLTAAGVVGGALFSGMLFISATAAARLREPLFRQVALAGLMFALVSGFTITILFHKFFWLILICCMPIPCPAGPLKQRSARFPARADARPYPVGSSGGGRHPRSDQVLHA